MTDRPQAGTAEWAAYWQQQIEAAQAEPTVMLAGVSYRRIPYGRDYPDGLPQCRDCGVEHGQLHVPACCVERCPRCDGQAISCLCDEPH